MRPSFFHHLHPPSIPRDQARWRHTLGAGGAALFLLLILAISGLLELFYYLPTPQEAALSVQIIAYHVPFGGLIRNLHFWSAQLLILVSGLHFLRVIFTAAYSRKRRFNYLLGLSLFLMLILLDFSGYILRWDEGIRYPLITGSQLLKSIPWAGGMLYRIALGSQDIYNSLPRIFIWHVFALILPTLVLVIWHIFRVRRDGGIAAPPQRRSERSARLPRDELVRREILAMLLISIALILLSVLVPAPIAPPMGAHPLDETVRAPWFFLWVQALLKWGNPLIFGILLPAGLLIFIAAIPYILPQPAPESIGRWFPPSNRAAQISVGLIGLLILVLSLTIK